MHINKRPKRTRKVKIGKNSKEERNEMKWKLIDIILEMFQPKNFLPIDMRWILYGTEMNNHIGEQLEHHQQFRPKQDKSERRKEDNNNYRGKNTWQETHR